VIVDLAAETGGNCELTQPGLTHVHHGITIAGPLNLPSLAPLHASEMYARNLLNFLSLSLKDGQYQPDWNDDLVAGTCLVRDGQITHAPTQQAIEGGKAP
jgi:NAD(P) transhydrogenase subunit alpha